MSTIPNTDAVEPLTREEEHRILEPIDPWSDTFALKIAVQDFHKAESYRTQNADWRWRNANELYLGWVNQKYWEGTKIPRASIPVYVAFEQVEALLPKLIGAIFSDNPWFQADPGLGTPAQAARQFAALVHDQMEETSVREIFRRVIKDGMIYGNGICGLSWESQEIRDIKYVPRWKQKPIGPQFPGMPPQMGEPRRVLEKVETKEIVNRPRLEHIQLPDFYIDPNACSPIIQDAAYCCVRAYKPISYLDSLRQNKEFNIPSRQELIQLAELRPTAQGDQTKAAVELYRSGSWQPQLNQTVDPAGQQIEIIARWSEDRVVWVIDRQITVLNKPNPYGFTGFYDAFYADVPGRFYAQGICDVVEGEQRLQVSVLNARLDELSLSIHPPTQVRRGLNIPGYNLRSRPGQVIQVDQPGKDYVITVQPNITANAYVETQASENRVQKTTGLSDMAVLGTPSSGGNSANRTAAGIGAQSQAANSRIQYIVENLEDTFIEPILNDIVKLNKLYPPPGAQAAQVVALSKVKLFMRASAKMQSRMALLQTYPLVLQSVANPAFLQQLAATGQTINFQEMLAMLLDMTGYRNRADLLRPLTPQEMQSMNQPSTEDKIRMQMQKERIQGQASIEQMKQQHDAQMKEMELQNDHLANRTKFYGDLAKALIPTAIDAALGGDQTA